MWNHCRHIARSIIALSVLICLWELAAHFGACGGRWPHLIKVISSIFSNFGDLSIRTLATCYAVTLSLFFGVFFGIPLGMLLSCQRVKSFGAYDFVAAMRPLPVTVLIPVFISAFGLETFAVPLIAVPILANVSVNTASAIGSCGQRKRQLFASWEIPRFQYVWHVLVFEVMESIAATLRIMIPYALALNIALDYFLHVNNGLGAYVDTAYSRYSFDQMFGGIFVVVIIGLFLTMFVDHFLARALQWKIDI